MKLPMLDRARNEPALIVGVVEAVLVAAIAFGIDLTAEQTAALLAVVVAVGALITRQTVYGPRTVADHPAGPGTLADPAAPVGDLDPNA
jgi:hypothetical protein